MTPEQAQARICLGDGGYLIDPKYAQNKTKEENRLKARCRACKHLKQWFPDFVIAYFPRWTAEAQDVRATERPASEVDNPGATPER